MEGAERAMEEIQSLVHSLNFPSSCAEHAVLQFQAYQKKGKNEISRDNLGLIIRCALLIAVKSETGIQGNAFEQIMNQYTDRIDECMLMLKEWLTFGQMNDEIRLEIKILVEQFSFMLAISTKFEKVFKIIGLQQQTQPQKNYNRNLKHLCWLMFLLSRQSSQQYAIIETTLHIASIFSFLLSGIQRFTSSSFIEENQGNQKQALLKHFNIQDIESYEVVSGRFISSVKHLCERHLLECEGDLFSIFSPSVLEQNIKKLSSYYVDTKIGDLNEELFVQEKKQVSVNPINLTPFSRQGGYNKQAAPFPQEKYGGSSTSSSSQQENHQHINILAGKGKFTSQRLLNYEGADAAGIEKKPISEFRSPGGSNNIASPLIGKGPQVARVNATPITNAMEMYNWLHSRKNILSCSQGTIALDMNKKIPNLENWLSELLNKLQDLEKSESGHNSDKGDSSMESRSVEQRKQQITSLFYRILNEYMSEEKTASLAVQKGVFICACESVYFILNLRTMSFEKLVSFLDLSWFELWKVMDFYMRLDQAMPLSLKAHVLDLEAKVVSYYSWREDSQLLSFVRAYTRDSEAAKKLLDDRQEGYAIEKFFRRVLHQCAYCINQICSTLRVSDQLSESVWRIMKHVLGNQSELLIGRHLDQLILCSIYVMCKIFKTETQFKQILNKYEELNSHNKPMMRELIYDLPITQEKRDTIVEYYNQIYLPQLKKASLLIYKQITSEPAIGMCSPIKPQEDSQQLQQQPQKNPAISGQVFSSPLKAMLPVDVRKSIQKLPSHMTPQTQMLYAYNESPLLKDGLVSQQGFKNLNSKKMINFDANPIAKTNSNSNTQNKQQQLQQQDKIAFAKYIKPNMDSIAESQQETFSNFIPNKFKKMTEGATFMKRNLFKQSANTEEESDSGEHYDTINNNTNNNNNNNNNNSNISIQSAPRIPNSPNSSSQQTAIPDQTNNTNINIYQNSANTTSTFNGSFLKNFTKQSQYQTNQFVSPLKQTYMTQTSSSRLGSPSIQQQYQQQQQPLQPIPQHTLNSMQNQTSSMNLGVKQQFNNFFENFKKKS